MDQSEILHKRFANQHLTKSKFKTPTEVVAAFGAMQSQDFGPGLWGIGLRLPGSTEAQVEQAFTEGSILRTHVMRPTWHFVAPADIRWMLALTAARVKITMRSVNQRTGLTAEDFKRSKVIIRKALRGKHLTRNELGEELQKAGLRKGNEESLRMAHFMMEAELDAIITSGPRRGKQFTYALMDERAPQAKDMKHDEALSELARRYFTTRGPASAKDFAWWSGLAMPDVRKGIEALGSELEQEEIDGKSYWFFSSRPPANDISKQAYLLQSYDEYGIGYVDRSAFYDPGSVKKYNATLRPFFPHTVVIDGRMAGVWKRELKAEKAVFILSMFRPLKKSEKEKVIKATERYGRFLNLKPEITFVK